MWKFSYIKISLTIIVICSAFTFYGVFKILKSHQYSISKGATTDMNFVKIIKDLDVTDQNCQDRLQVLEEQIDTLFEFHNKENSKVVVKYLDK